jgi:hypothetical protein
MSLLTLSAPAIWAAFASTACFSLSELTGPFKVTMPFCAMIVGIRGQGFNVVRCIEPIPLGGFIGSSPLFSGHRYK